MAFMVTDKAAEVLHITLDNIEKEPTQVLRLIADRGGLSITLDEKHDDDQVVEHDGQAVMVVEPMIQEELSGQTLDFDETPEGGRLTLRA
jgi:Fe-S cluster assembly iron-binding protein IscA